MRLNENEKLVDPKLEKLSYRGRIDFFDISAPIFIFPGSSVSMSFTGALLKIIVKNNHGYYDNYLGYVIDGIEKKILLSNYGDIQEITLADDLKENEKHEVVIFKRQDGCHEFTFYGFVIAEGGEVNSAPKNPRRCMEFYGDSPAAGHMVEVKDFHPKSYDKYNGQYSNVWNSYAMITARNLKAQANIIAQEGAALLNRAGYFHAPNTIGMESIYDKLHFNPDLGEVTAWDFKKYTPHVVVVDIGQNDSFPEDYMKEDGDGERATIWKAHYRDFVLNIRKRYEHAFIILTTTVMKHHPSWDRAIGSICQEINDEKVLHFLYSSNGYGCSYAVNEYYAEQMALELSMFLKGLGPEVWKSY